MLDQLNNKILSYLENTTGRSLTFIGEPLVSTLQYKL